MGSWGTRWRATSRIAWRDAKRHRGRTAVVVAMIMLPVFAATLLTTVVRSGIETPETMVQNQLGDSAQALLQDSGCQRVTQDPSSGSSACWERDDSEPVPVSEMLALLPPGSDLVPQYSRSAVLRTAGAQLEVSWLQVDTQQVPGLAQVRDGSGQPGRGEAVLDTPTADRLGVSLGDIVEIVGSGEAYPATIVGLEPPRRAAEVTLGAGTIPWDESRADGWLVIGSEPVTWADLQALNEIGVMVTSREVILHPPPVEAVDAHIGYASESSTQTIGLIGAVVVIGILEAVLLIGPAFSVGAKRSARQLALVAASGGRPKDLRRIVLSAGLVTGALAGALGAVLGVGGGLVTYFVASSHVAWFPNLVLPTWEAGAAIGVALLLGLAAAWIPARAAGRTDVVAALSGRRAEAGPRRRVPWIGVGLTAAGFAAAIYGASVGGPELLIAGVLGIQIGLVMASGALIALAARLAPRLRAPARFALRDAQRQRGRTAPAVAAVLAAVAAATAGMSYMASEAAASEASWTANAQDGTGYLLAQFHGVDSVEHEESVDEAIAVLEDAPVEMELVPIHALLADGSGYVSLRAQPDPSLECPEDLDLGERLEDPRCPREVWISSGYWWGVDVVVDDGTMIGAIGLPGAAEAAQALAEGKVLINDPTEIWADGSARIAYHPPDADREKDAPVVVEWPAQLVEWESSTYDLVLSPEAAGEFEFGADAIEIGVGGALLIPSEPFEQEQIEALNRALADVDPALSVAVEGWQRNSDSLTVSLVLTAIALVIALVATALSVGLAAAESRPDLATLAAVGAGPRVRRRIAGAQAGVITVLGTVVGLVTGLALAYVLSSWQQQDEILGLSWEFTVPWPALGLLAIALPGLAILGAMALTRSRLPMLRRLAQ